MRTLASAGLAAAWLALAGAAPLPTTVPAAAAATVGSGAAEEHRAAVIVDTGTEVRSVCVRFSEESITGVEALARAQVDPVFHGYSGKGAAVCALCGVGCPAGDSCLTCDAGGRFWSYSRAAAGDTALRTSPVGASSTTVRDGDVEGWRYALGGTPPFATVDQVCSGAVPAATATTAAPGTPATGPAVTGGPGPTARGPAPVVTGATPATSSPRAPGSTATTADGGGGVTRAPPVATAPPSEVGVAGDVTGDGPSAPADAVTGPGDGRPAPGLAASRTGAGRDGGGGWLGLAAWGTALAGLVGWTALARRARRRLRP